MLKNIVYALFLCMTAVSTGFGQLSINFTGGTAPANGTIDVDVTVGNFDQIVSAQFSINWDASVMAFNSIQNITSSLPEFTEAGNIGTPVNAAAVGPGQTTVSWSLMSTNPFSLPDDTRLFTIRFSAVGQACASTDLIVTDLPRVIEVADDNLVDIGLSAAPASVSIDGTNCDGGGNEDGICDNSPDISVIIENISAAAGSSVCIPVTTRNFSDIAGLQTAFSWNTSILSYTGINESSLTGIPLNENNTDSGELRVLWNSPTGIGFNFNDGSTLFEICFNVVGNTGQNSNIGIGDTSFSTEIVDGNTQSIAFCFDDGRFTVGDGGGGGDDCSSSPDFSLIAGNVSGASGSNLCVPISTRNFSDIAGVQTAFTWNTSALTYTGIQEQNLTGIPLNEGNTSSGELRMLWNSPTGNGFNFNDGDILFSICFDINGNEGQSTDVEIGQSSFSSEVVNGNTDVLPFCFQDGSVTISGDGGGDDDPMDNECVGQPDFSLVMFNSNFNQNASTVCIPVSALNFDNISGIQTSFNWNNSTITFVELREENLTGISLNQDQITQGELGVVWSNSAGGINLNDEAVLFHLCFNVVGDVADFTDIEIGTSTRINTQILEGGGDDGGGMVSDPDQDRLCDSSSDFSLIIRNINAAPNSNVCVPVTSRRFNDIAGLQTSFTWNPSRLNYTGLTERALTGIPLNSSQVANGELRMLWSTPTGNGFNFDDDQVLFELCFDVNAANGQTADLDIGQSSAFATEIVDGNTAVIASCFDGGRLFITDGTSTGSEATPVDFCLDGARVTIIDGNVGGDCGMTDDFALQLGTVSGENGENVCISVSTRNFSDITGLQTGISWDSNVLRFTGLTERNLTGTVVNDGNAANGSLKFLWSTATGNGFNYSDGDILFDLCFDLVGDANSTSSITLGALSDFGIEIVDNSLVPQALPFCFETGTVNISEPLIPTVSLTVMGASMVDQGSEICFDIVVDKFNNIQSAQFNLTWDQSVLSYTRFVNPEVLNGFGLSNVNFIDPNVLRVSWNPFTAQSVGDDSTIFQVCFTGVGDCQNMPSTSIDFVSAGGIDIEITNTDDQTLIVDGNAGNVQIAECGECNVSFNDVVVSSISTCFGDQVGAITGNIGGQSNENVNCIWRNSDGEIIQSSNDCNITNLGAGDYTLSIELNGAVCFTDTYTINQRSQIQLDAVIKDVDCQGLGSIMVEVSGGLAPYNYSWTSDLSDDGIVRNLDIGTYVLVVTDDNNCSVSREFVISDVLRPIQVVSSNIGNRSCENDSFIEINVDDGCGAYTFEWIGPNQENFNSRNLDNPAPGVWNLKISDQSEFSDDFITTYEILNLAGELGFSLDMLSNEQCNGQDGSISISVNGGCEPFRFNWQGPNGTFTTEDIMDLESGEYFLTITDAKNDIVTSSLEVGNTQSFEVQAIISNINSIEGNDGEIELMVSGSTGDVVVSWSDGSPDLRRIGLSPGVYEVNISDGSGCSVTQTYEIVWDAIFANNIIASNGGMITCLDAGDGEISGDIIGGCGGNEIRINGVIVDQLPLTDLNAGTYEVVVSDACGNMDTKIIEFLMPDPISISVLSTQCVDEDNLGTIEIGLTGGSNNFVITWSRGTVAPDGNEVSDLTEGPVTVVITDLDCRALDITQEFEVLSCDGPPSDLACDDVRSVITPNGDGMNDTFLIGCLENGMNQDNRLTVYDRWGRLVFGSTSYDNSWNGIDNQGNELDEGGYMWVLEVNNPNGSISIERGSISLLRG